MILRTSTSHEEGCHREWSILTKEFRGDANGHVESLVTVRIEWTKTSRAGTYSRKSPAPQEDWPLPIGAAGDGLCRPGKARADCRFEFGTGSARQRQVRRAIT